MSRDLNGTTDYLALAAGGLITTFPFTMSIWFKADTLATANKELLSFYDDPSVGSAMRLTIRADSIPAWRISFNFFDGSYHEVFTSSAMSTGVWTNIVVVATNASSYAIFTNGGDKQTGSDATTQTLTNLDRFEMGRLAFTGDSLFDGKLAYGAFWNGVALSDADVALLSTKGPLLVGTPTSYWPLTSNTSPEPDDAAGGSNDLTVSGAAFSADNPTLDLTGTILFGARVF